MVKMPVASVRKTKWAKYVKKEMFPLLASFVALFMAFYLGSGDACSVKGFCSPEEHLRLKNLCDDRDEFIRVSQSHLAALDIVSRRDQQTAQTMKKILLSAKFNEMVVYGINGLDTTAVEMGLVRSAIIHHQTKKISREKALAQELKEAQNLPPEKRKDVRPEMIKNQQLWDILVDTVSEEAIREEIEKIGLA